MKATGEHQADGCESGGSRAGAVLDDALIAYRSGIMTADELRSLFRSWTALDPSRSSV